MRRLRKYLPLSWRRRKSAEWLAWMRNQYDEGVRIRDQAKDGYNRAYMDLRLARLAEINQRAQDEFDTYGVIGGLRRGS